MFACLECVGANQTGPMLMKLTTTCDVGHIISYTSPLFFSGNKCIQCQKKCTSPAVGVTLSCLPKKWRVVTSKPLAQLTVQFKSRVCSNTMLRLVTPYLNRKTIHTLYRVSEKVMVQKLLNAGSETVCTQKLPHCVM